jgi:hypothetical protein
MARPKKPQNINMGSELLQTLPYEVVKLKEISINILNYIDKYVSSPELGVDETGEYGRIIGTKNSLTDTFIKLSDLILQLAYIGIDKNNNINTLENSRLPQADLELVKSFLSRQMAAQKETQ